MPPTKERILVEASRLFAWRGYHGTSTRDIAEAVGVRQPSIYKHFATKHLILVALLDADLVPARRRIETALELPGPVAPRLYAYLHVEVEAILTLPYDVRGVYNDDVLASPELAEQAGHRAEMHRLTGELVAAGIARAELVATDAPFVQHAITGLLLETARERGTSATGDLRRARDVADFVLRATLADPSTLPALREPAARMAAQIKAATGPGLREVRPARRR